jgi:hypothetical protein
MSFLMTVSHTDQPDLSLARRAWRAFEPYHAMVYFALEGREVYTAAGLKGFWMGYFASRAAAMGAVSASMVTATFYNFHPRMVERAIPDAWRFSSPERVLQARLQVADLALRRLLGEQTTSAEVAEAAELAREATTACSVGGRPLFAGYNTLPWPTEPHLALWHAATLLREFRGDGHIAALLTAGIDGCEAHITLVATGRTSREAIQPHRGWNDEEWEAAQQRLQQRGVLDENLRLTEAGKTLRQAIEDQTDLLALAPWQHLGDEKYARLLSLVSALSTRIVEQGGMPIPNPMAAPQP